MPENPDIYIFPGDAAHLQDAIDRSAVPVNPRIVRAFSSYHNLTRTLCNAAQNPEHGQEILATVRPHLAVAIDLHGGNIGADCADVIGDRAPQQFTGRCRIRHNGSTRQACRPATAAGAVDYRAVGEKAA